MSRAAAFARCAAFMVGILAVVAPVAIRDGFVALAAATQQGVVAAAPDRSVSGADETLPLVEPHLAVNPADPRHLVAAAMIVAVPDLSVLECAVFSTFDGGAVWSRHDLGLPSCGDPWLAITSHGTALLAVLGDRGEMRVYRSPDGGRTWPAQGVQIDGAHDHEMLLASADQHSVYLVSGRNIRDAQGRLRSGLSVVVSIDDGETFVEAGVATPLALSFEAQTPALLSNGRLLIPFQDHHRLDGRRLERRRSWLVASADAGQTFSVPVLITEGCNRRGPVGWPSLAAIGAGPYRDRLVWVCEEQDDNGILVHRSIDAGETWSDRVRVDGGPDVGAWTKVPTIATGPDGNVMITWLDRRDDPERACQYLYASVSVDGGETFSSAARVSSAPSCPDPGTDVSGRFPAGGDYTGLVAIGPGRFQAVWADARDGVFRLRTTELRIADLAAR